jgi:hypothetical protein
MKELFAKRVRENRQCSSFFAREKEMILKSRSYIKVQLEKIKITDKATGS